MTRPEVKTLELENIVYKLVNNQRTRNNLPPLTYDIEIAEIARKHSLDMARNDYLEHVNLIGQDPTDRGNEAGYDCIKDYGSYYTYGLAENIYQNWLYSSTTYINGVPNHNWDSQEEIAETTVEGWMESKGHRENILDSSYDRTGIGVAIADNDKVYITQNFC